MKNEYTPGNYYHDIADARVELEETEERMLCEANGERFRPLNARERSERITEILYEMSGRRIPSAA